MPNHPPISGHHLPTHQAPTSAICWAAWRPKRFSPLAADSVVAWPAAVLRLSWRSPEFDPIGLSLDSLKGRFTGSHRYYTIYGENTGKLWKTMVSCRFSLSFQSSDLGHGIVTHVWLDKPICCPFRNCDAWIWSWIWVTNMTIYD